MKYLCPGCDRLVTLERAHLDGDLAVLECPKCGAPEQLSLEGALSTTSRSASQKKDSESPTRRKGPTCPKCGTPRGEGDACSRCGLTFEKWNPAAQPEPPEAAAILWDQLQDQWDDDDLHHQFFNVCFEAQDLAFAARCYRGRDDEISREQLERLTTLGVQAMQISEQPGRLNPKLFRTIGWAFFFVLCAALIIAAFSLR